MIQCRTCLAVKPINQFHLSRHKTPERQCKACKHARQYERRRDPVVAELVNANARKNYNPTVRRFHRMKSLYGLTQEAFMDLWDKQSGECAVCRSELEMTGKRGAQVDHDHESGRVRGLLCGNCNIALGHLKESVERIHGLLAYVEGFE